MATEKQGKEKKELPIEVKRIGLRLKQIRKERGFSSAEAYSYRYGLNRSQYGKYEAGSEDFRISSFAKILTKTNVKFSTFFNESYDSLTLDSDN